MGQRQLISFLRTLLKNPDILIIDEATSSVDPATEQKLQEALRKIVKDKTCIIIAHRPTTLRIAHRIITMEHGKIIGETMASLEIRAQ